MLKRLYSINEPICLQYFTCFFRRFAQLSHGGFYTSYIMSENWGRFRFRVEGKHSVKMMVLPQSRDFPDRVFYPSDTDKKMICAGSL